MKDASENTISRRTFLGSMAAASAFTIVPRRVLGGPGFTAPSDRLNLGQIGCGTQALRQVNTGLLGREDLHFSCVCDPNTESADYLDWSRHGMRDRIRRFLEDPTWGGDDEEGIRAGREYAKRIIETYYGKTRPSGSYLGIRSYADFRELLDRETDLDGVVVITPDHLHASISVAAMEKGIAAISHKPVSNVLHEVRRAVDTARGPVVSHLLAYSNHPDIATLEAWIRGGVIGHVREVHNWSYRPSWPQGWLAYPEPVDVPAGLDWNLWLGPEPDRPYHPALTHTLYRGWYAFGSGCLGDMSNYSLWHPYRILELGVPESVESSVAHSVVVTDHVPRRVYSDVAFPNASTISFRHAAAAGRPAVDVIWYDGTIRPKTPEELREEGEELPVEGMLFVGDAGKILCDFRGRSPRLIPSNRMAELEGALPTPVVDETDETDEWVNAIRNDGRSRGGFDHIAELAEATCLGNISLRFPGRRLHWDADAVAFTNIPEANAFVTREYRPGWEM